jgi:hypothetical protein
MTKLGIIMQHGKATSELVKIELVPEVDKCGEESQPHCPDTVQAEHLELQD